MYVSLDGLKGPLTELKKHLILLNFVVLIIFTTRFCFALPSLTSEGLIALHLKVYRNEAGVFERAQSCGPHICRRSDLFIKMVTLRGDCLVFSNVAKITMLMASAGTWDVKPPHQLF